MFQTKESTSMGFLSCLPLINSIPLNNQQLRYHEHQSIDWVYAVLTLYGYCGQSVRGKVSL